MGKMSHNVLPDLKLPTRSSSRERHSSLDNTQEVKTTLSRESSSSSEGKRRRPGRMRDRFRLSASDTMMECGKNVRSEERKRKSMSDYLGIQLFYNSNPFNSTLDLKAKENSTSEEVGVKDQESKNKEPRRRKLSAEMIRNAIQRKANTISHWTTGQKNFGNKDTDNHKNTAVTDKPERKKMINKKLTPIPSEDIPSDTEADYTLSPNGKGILKKVSNAELPNLELFQSVHKEESR